MTSIDSYLDGSPAWNAIVQYGPLHLTPQSATTDANTIVLQSTQLFNLQFSASNNNIRFPSATGTASTASVENTSRDAVLGLLIPPPPAPPTPPLSFTFTRIKAQFGLDATNTSSEFATFVTAVDVNNALPLDLDPTPTARSALWMLSGMYYRSVVQLVFQLPASANSNIKTFIRNQYGLAIEPVPNSPIRLSVRMITAYTPNLGNPAALKSTSTYEIFLDVPVPGLEMSFVFGPDGLNLRVSNPSTGTRPTGNVFDRINAALLGNAGSSSLASGDLPTGSPGSPFNSFFSSIDFWYVSLAKSSDKSTTADAGGNFVETFGALHWQINLIADWQSRAGVVVALRYDSRTSSFSGRLLFDTGPSPYANRLWDFDFHTDLSSATSKTLPSPIDAWTLFGLGGSAPPQVPHLLTDGQLIFQKLPDGFSLGVSATIESDTGLPATSPLHEAPHGFSWDMLTASARLLHSGSQDTLALQLSSEMSMNAKPGSGIPPATLYVDLEYDTSGSWLLHAQIAELKFALLYSYLHPSVQDSAVKMLGGLDLKNLELLYTYSPSSVGGQSVGSASSFYIAGSIVLGKLELDLSYEYNSTALPSGSKSASQIYDEMLGITYSTNLPPATTTDQWSFAASLGASSPNSTIGDIAFSLTGKTVLPDFVGGIPINAAAGGNAAVKLILRGSGLYTGVAVAITIGSVSMMFVSLHKTGDDSYKPKTILRVMMDQIPLASQVPLIKELPQPFDRILYIWIDDDNTQLGLTKEELEAVNDELSYLSIPKVDYKEVTTDGSLPPIRDGHHFMVIDKGQVVVDYRFTKDDADSEPADPNAPPAPAGGDTGHGETPPDKGALDKQLPFLSITGVSLMFKQGSIGIEFNATVKLGPITFSLIEFDLGVKLSSIHLDNLKSITPTADLHGLAVELNAPPVTLAGVFIHDKSDSLETYRGGISLGFEAWKFLAVGEYAIVDGGEYKSVFVFAKLNGPLISLGFATVTGVRIGLGYNSAVRSPAISEIFAFPFLSGSVDSNSGDDPMSIVLSMTDPVPTGPPWVSRKKDSYWLAAGVTLTAFGILSVTAVMMFQVQPGGFIISVFANGIAQLPCEVQPEATLFYVEVGMMSEINTVEGYFTVQAALAPASHVLIASCRLTGGFAMVNWFDPSTHSGDFVFTVGGYHRAYTPPSWYPKVDRIGVSFTVGSMINVTGGVYFAITPKCVMGGGGLHMGLDVGPVSAWVDISLDVFIQFKPFHYTADLMVSVGCAISIKVWFVHIRIKASVGASLHIEGPDPFGGFANIDFYLFSFTIHFGGNAQPPPPATLEEFYEMVHKPGPDSKPADDPSQPVDEMMSRLKFTLDAGLFPQPLPPRSVTGAPSGSFPDSGPSKGWIVKSGAFVFSINCDFALSSASMIQQTSEILIFPPDSSAINPVYSKPMHVDQPITSNLVITIWSLDPHDLSTINIIDGFTATMTVRDMPAALWGPYAAADDPASGSSATGLRDPGNPTRKLCMGVTVTRPENPNNLIPSGIEEFKPTVALREPIGGPFYLETSAPALPAFVASGSLFPQEQSDTARWNDFGHDWIAAGSDAAQIVGAAKPDGSQDEGVLKMAAEWLGWNVPPPSGNGEAAAAGTRPSWVLDGKTPMGLVGALDTEYLVLPRECGA